MRSPVLVAVLLLLCPALPARAGEASFDSDGVKIRYVKKGKGDPVVLVHGFSRSVELTWGASGLLDALAADFRVIALDCRGHGKSDRPAGDAAYGKKMVGDVARLLDHLEIDRARVVGYSMGGRIALKFAATHPDRVRSVVLVAAGGACPGDDHSLWDEVAKSLDRGNGIVPLIRKIWPTGQPLPTDDQLRAVSKLALAGNDSKALAAVARSYRELATTREELDRVMSPVTAVIGSRDGFKPSVDALKKRKPGVTVVMIDGADHVGILGNPEARKAVAAALRK